jgi:phage gpG-like protein
MTNNVTINLDGLNKLRDALSGSKVVKVGILADTNSRQSEEGEDISNAELGVIHEFGSMSRNIPARSFLKMPLERPELKAFIMSKKITDLVAEGKIETALTLIGLKAEEIIDKAFQTRGFGKWQPLKQATIRRKGSTAPLIDTRQLQRSITSEVVNA